MDNYGNIMHTNMEYSNIVYTGQQQEMQHPPPHHDMVVQGHENNIYQPQEMEDTNVLAQQPQHLEPVAVVVPEEVQPSFDEIAPQQPVDDAPVNSNEIQTEQNQVELDKSVVEENHQDEVKTEESVKEEIVEEKVIVATPVVAASTTSSKKQNDQEIDPNQCRCCMKTTGLVDIFMIEDTLRFSDKIILICPAVKITKNDYLPHFICETCLANLKTAYNFKVLCEQTDQELRKKLKRGKNKARRAPTEFIMIDCNDASESDIDEPADDDEFHVSGSLSEAASSDSSFSIGKKKKTGAKTKRRSRASTRKSSANSTPAASSTKKKTPNSNKGVGGNTRSTRNRRVSTPSPEPKRARREIVLIKAAEESDDDDDTPLKARSKKTKQAAAKATPAKTNKSSPKPALTPVEKPLGDGSKPYKCPFCDKTFNSPAVLRDHKKLHEDTKPFVCTGCQKQFKQKKNYTAHMTKHRDDKGVLTCGEKKKAPATAAAASSVTSSTEKKKKSEFEISNFGRDLFKCVAPLTTTYWSDSFSD